MHYKEEFYREVTSYYNSDSKDYEERYKKNWILQKLRHDFRHITEQYDFKTAIDVGCGPGFDLAYFGQKYPTKMFYGLDISSAMIKKAMKRIKSKNLDNVVVKVGNAESIPSIFRQQRFDMIYSYFGVLNTVKDLSHIANIFSQIITQNGTVVFSVVNKWYILGIIGNLFLLRVKKAFSRLNEEWHGYAPDKPLPSSCLSPQEIENSFSSSFKIVKTKGYSILFPPWYLHKIFPNASILEKILWMADKKLNQTPLWPLGEYALYVLKPL